MEDAVKTALLNVFHQALKATGIAVFQDILTVVQHHAAQGTNLLETTAVQQVTQAIQASLPVAQ